MVFICNFNCLLEALNCTKLKNRPKGIERVSVRQSDENAPAFATVYVPFRAANHFQRLLDEYRTQLTARSERPRHETIVNRIDSVALAAIRSLFTDDENLLPALKCANLVGDMVKG